MYYLKTYQSVFPKKRLGRESDGGYVIIDDLGGYDLCISCGIANDISFERAFHEHYPDVKIVAYDGTIRGLPKYGEFIEFRNQNITKENNLENAEGKNIFLKMDIERAEYEWLNSVTDLLKYKQIVIEIHMGRYLTEADENLFNKLNENHWLMHVHGNNYGGIIQGTAIPQTLECTYVRFDSIVGVSPNQNKLPSVHDRPNKSSARDYDLNFAPFVNID